MKRYLVKLHGVNKQFWNLDLSQEAFDDFMIQIKDKWVNINDSKKIKGTSYKFYNIFIKTETVSYFTVEVYEDNL